MSEASYPSLKCNKNVSSDAIECYLCLSWSHRTCAKLTKKELELLSINDNYWYCNECLAVFPYIEVDEDEFIYIHSNVGASDNFLNLLYHCKSIQADHNETLENDKSAFDKKKLIQTKLFE